MASSMMAPDDEDIDFSQTQQLGIPPAPQVTPPAPGNLTNASRFASSTITDAENRAIDATNNAAQAQNDATAAGIEAANSQARADRAESEVQQPAWQQFVQDASKFEEAYKADMQDVRRRSEEGLNRYMAITADKRDTHVYNWWSSASTGARILGLVSEALAGVGQALLRQSGPTPMDRVIEQGFQEAKLNAQLKGEAVNQAGQLYRDLRSQLKDEVLVRGAMLDIAYKSTIQRAEAYAKSLGNDKQVQANLQKFKSVLLQKQADNQMQTAQYIGKLAQDNAQAKGTLTSHWEQIWGQRDMQKKAQGAAVGVYGIPGSEALPPEDRRKLKEKYDGTVQIMDHAEQLAHLLDGETTDPKTGKTIKIRDSGYSNAAFAGEINQHLSTLTYAIKDLYRLGQISGGDQKLVNGTVGIDGGWSAEAAAHVYGASTYGEMAKRIQNYAKQAQKDLYNSASGWTVNGERLKPGTPPQRKAK